MSETKEQYEARMAAAIAARNEDGTAPANKPAGAKALRGRRSSDAGRWHTLNAFVDVIAPRLTPVERAVWLVMFRYTRNGVCETSERSIATQANIDKASAGKSLRRLVELGLAWVLFKSISKGTPSRYGLHPSPHACLPTVIAADEARCRNARERREQRGGDGRGRRRKAEPSG